MAHNPNPNDPFTSPDDPYLTTRPDDARRQARLDQERYDSELPSDPDLAEGSASGGKIAMFAVAIALVLGAVFYGLNNSSVNHAGTSSTAQNTTQTSPPAAPLPRPNTAPGTTTGAAPASPQTTPAPAPAGQEINRTANPPADNMPSK
jgi:cell division septation protein DedD